MINAAGSGKIPIPLVEGDISQDDPQLDIHGMMPQTRKSLNTREFEVLIVSRTKGLME